MKKNNESTPKPPNECSICGYLIDPRLDICQDCFMAINAMYGDKL